MELEGGDLYGHGPRTYFLCDEPAGRSSRSDESTSRRGGVAVITGGLIGAISQQLRRAEPLWATVALVWFGLPGAMLLAQSGVHHLAGTPHLTGGLILSFFLAAISAAFSWFAMRHGAMLGGVDETTILHDLRALPGIFMRFLLAGPVILASFFRTGGRV